MTEVKNKAWINKQIEQHLLETEGEEYTGYEAGIEFVQLLIEETEIKLNEDQQVVLDWLKQNTETDKFRLNPIATVFKLHNNFEDSEEELVNASYLRLDETEEFEVLQAFAEWGLSDK